MNIVDYFRQTRVELRQVKWSSRSQAINYTIVVIALSLGVAAFLSFFDVVFGWLLKLIWG